MAEFVLDLFSKFKTKSVPLNPHVQASDDDFEPEWSLSPPASVPAGSSRRSLSSDSFSSSSPDLSSSTALLPKTGKKKAIWNQRLEKAKRYGTAFMKIATSTALSHVATGSGGIVNIPDAVSAGSHYAAIKQLLEEPCDVNKPDVCQGLVAFALHQKGQQFDDALMKILPLVGMGRTAKNKIHAIDKQIAGAAGKDRLAEARLLVEHAKECHVALALFAELVYGDLTKKSNFRKALRVVDNDLQWGSSDEEPVEVAVSQLAPKMKSVI